MSWAERKKEEKEEGRKGKFTDIDERRITTPSGSKPRDECGSTPASDQVNIYTVYWFLSAHLGADNFRLNSLMSVEHILIGDPYVVFLSGVGVAPARGVQFLQEGVSVRLSRFPVAMWYCG